MKLSDFAPRMGFPTFTGLTTPDDTISDLSSVAIIPDAIYGLPTVPVPWDAMRRMRDKDIARINGVSGMGGAVSLTANRFVPMKFGVGDSVEEMLYNYDEPDPTVTDSATSGFWSTAGDVFGNLFTGIVKGITPAIVQTTNRAIDPTYKSPEQIKQDQAIRAATIAGTVSNVKSNPMTVPLLIGAGVLAAILLIQKKK